MQRFFLCYLLRSSFCGTCSIATEQQKVITTHSRVGKHFQNNASYKITKFSFLSCPVILCIAQGDPSLCFVTRALLKCSHRMSFRHDKNQHGINFSLCNISFKLRSVLTLLCCSQIFYLLCAKYWLTLYISVLYKVQRV